MDFVRRWILGELEMVELRNKVISVPACGGEGVGRASSTKLKLHSVHCVEN